MKKGAITYVQQLQLPQKLFPTLFFGYLFALLPFWILATIAVLLGADFVKFNDETVTGVKALLTVTMVFPIQVLAFTCFTWMFLKLGYWIIGLLPSTKD